MNLSSKYLDIILKNIHYYYLFCILIYLLLYAIITPPFASPDEHNHFRKAASKELLYLNGPLKIDKNIQGFSEEIKNNHFKDEKINLDKYFDSSNKKNTYANEYQDADLANLYGYPYYAYFLSKIGFKFSKLFTENIITSFYFGRIFNLSFFLLTSYILLKYSPTKEYFYILLCFPTTLSLASSYNADSFIFSTTCLFLYFFIKKKENLDLKSIIICNLLMFLISLIKPVYIFLNLIIFFYTKKYFKLNIAMNIIIIILLLIFFSNYHEMETDNNLSTKIFNLKYLIFNPFSAIKLIFLTFVFESKHYAYEIIGSVGHMLNINHYFSFYIITLIYVIYYLLRNIEFTKESFFSFIIFLLTAVGIILTIYINTNTVEQYETIKNVRGRYLLVILFFIGCILNSKIITNLNYKNKSLLLTYVILLILLNIVQPISLKDNIIFIIFSYLTIYFQYFRDTFKLLLPHLNLYILYNIYNFYYL